MDWLELASRFLPPFLGVLFAFGIDRLWGWGKDRKDKRKFLSAIKGELESCSKLLVGRGNLCPIDMWKGGVSSGLMRLISQETINELTSTYFRLECHNYDAVRAKDVSILSVSEMGKPRTISRFELIMKNLPAEIKSHTQLLHYYLSKDLIEAEEKLKSDIDNLLKNKKLWN